MTFGQIRFIKWTLFLLFLGLLGSVSYYVWLGVKGRETASEFAIEEPESAVSREIRIEQLDPEGNTAWVLEAAESVGRTESSQLFRDVEIRFDSESQGEPVPITVNAERCEIRSDNSVRLEGNVVVRDESSLRLEAETLEFRQGPDRIWSTDAVKYFRDGLSGTAGNMRYFTQPGDLMLGGGVDMVLRETGEAPMRITSRSASMSRRRSEIRYVDRVRVRQTGRALDCNDLQIYLDEDSSEIERIEGYGRVDLRFDGRESEAEIVPDETADAEASGSGSDIVSEPGRKRLLTDRLEMLLRPGGEHLERVRALEGGRLVIELPEGATDGYRKELEGYTLAFDFDADGRLVTLRGRGGVTLVLTPAEGSSEQRKVVTARQLESDFDPETGDLMEARCSRSVTFEQGEVRAEAEEGTFQVAESLLVLEEDPKLWDAEARLEGDVIHVNVDSGDVDATGNVRSTSTRSGNTGGKAGLFPASVENGAPVYFVSDRMSYSRAREVAVYTGAARGLQGNNRIEAERITLRDTEGELEARGNVRTVLVQRAGGKEGTPARPTVGLAGTLLYRSVGEVLQYRQGVELRSQEMTLRGESVDVLLTAGGEEVREILAEGEVEIQTPEGMAAGDLARYLPNEEKMTVTGERAWLANAGKLTEGKQLTFFLGDDKIFVDGREESRTKTTYSSKPRPF